MRVGNSGIMEPANDHFRFHGFCPQCAPVAPVATDHVQLCNAQSQLHGTKQNLPLGSCKEGLLPAASCPRALLPWPTQTQEPRLICGTQKYLEEIHACQPPGFTDTAVPMRLFLGRGRRVPNACHAKGALLQWHALAYARGTWEGHPFSPSNSPAPRGRGGKHPTMVHLHEMPRKPSPVRDPITAPADQLR